MSAENNIKVNIKLNPQFINMLSESIYKAASLTMADLKDDLVNSQTMPFDNGALQGDTFDKVSGKKGNETFVIDDGDRVRAAIINDVPYARYQYFGQTEDGLPFDYQTVMNPNANSHWLEPYRDGVFLTEHFNKNLKKVREGG